MSDPKSSLPPVLAQGLTQAAVKPDQAVRITAVRGGSIGDSSRVSRVEGEVVRVSKDDRTATIRTENGNEIDIAIKGRVTIEQGQKVELDLPPGRPPQQATLRPPQAVPVHVPARPQPLPDPADKIIPDRAADIPHTQITLTPELHEAIELADRLTPVPPRDTDPVPLPPHAIVRLLPLLSGLPPVLPAHDAQPSAPDQAALSTSAFKPAAPAYIIRPASAAPQISPPVAPLPPVQMPVQSITTFPVELIRIEMPSLQGEIHTLPGTVQAALETIGTLLHAGIFHTETMPSFIQPVITQATAIPSATELQGDIKSLAAAIRAPSAFITNISTPAVIEPLRFDAKVADIQPGQSIQIAPHEGHPLQQDTPSHSSHPAQGMIEGRVIATSMDHFPVLSVFSPGRETADLFMMKFPASNLPVGTELHLIPQISLPSIPMPVMQATPAFDLMTGWTWPALEDAATFLIQTGQPDGAKALANILPNAGDAKQMPPAILFLMTAVQAGDLAGWMGEKNLQLLRREGSKGGSDILSRLTRDFAGLSRLSQESNVQDWRSMAIPMMWQNDIQKIHLHYRSQHGEKDEDPDMRDSRSTRFIFDLHLTQMGEIQLDGLMKGRRLDLILRTRTQLSLPMQTAMREKYLGVLETGKLAGDLAFQNRVDQWVTIETRAEGWATSA